MSESDIVLVDDEGVEHHFRLFDVVDVDGQSYALLQPAESEDELVILRIEGSVEEGNLVTLDDDEWDRVARALEDEVIVEESEDE